MAVTATYELPAIEPDAELQLSWTGDIHGGLVAKLYEGEIPATAKDDPPGESLADLMLSSRVGRPRLLSGVGRGNGSPTFIRFECVDGFRMLDLPITLPEPIRGAATVVELEAVKRP